MKTHVVGIWHGCTQTITAVPDNGEDLLDRQTEIGRGDSKPATFDEGYLTRLRAGDEQTVKHFDSYFRRLLRLKLWGKFTREREEELVEKVMAAAIDKILHGQPSDASHLPAYIGGICLNLTKRSLRPSLNVIGVDLNQMQIPDTANNVEEKLIEHERAQSVRKVLGSLGRRDRGVLVDLFYHDTEREEVCRKYQVTRKTLRLILFRARQRFQSHWNIN